MQEASWKSVSNAHVVECATVLQKFFSRVFSGTTLADFVLVRLRSFVKKTSWNKNDSRSLSETVNKLLNRTTKVVYPSVADTSELILYYFVDKINKIRSDIRPGSSTVVEVSPRSNVPPCSQFQPVEVGNDCALINFSKQRSSLADPIPVPILGTIITHFLSFWASPNR